MNELKKTPLNETHKSLGAKTVPFSGWEMPVQYSSIINEHISTRTKAGLFDISHMGEIFIEGKGDKILYLLEKCTCNLVSKLNENQVQYNVILNEEGGLVDDVTIFKFNDNKYMVCSNAANFDAVFKHLNNIPNEVTIKNDSENWHLVAIQGPLANEIFEKYLGKTLDDISYFRFKMIPFQGEDILVSRTGYTGEDGFEIYTSNEMGKKLWTDLFEMGKKWGMLPVGLGARDTLRIEARYPLYGHELNAMRTPVESGLRWIVKEKDIPYFAYEKIIQQKKNGTEYNTTGIKLSEPGVLRERYKIYDDANNIIGETTSGTYSPTLKEGIGIAFVKSNYIQHKQKVHVEIRGVKKGAIIWTESFVQGRARRKK